VTIHVATLTGATPGATVPHFQIDLLPPEASHFPIRILTEPASMEHRHLAFVPGAGGHLCRGGAGPLIESAVERVQLTELVLAAIGWARRNLEIRPEPATTGGNDGIR
jgi:hypothetical protein